MKLWRSYHYKNLTILFISLICAFLISRIESFHTFLLGLGALGYIGAFIAGALFASSFTVATGAVILLILAEKLVPLELIFIGAIGQVMGDFLIYRLVKDRLIEEIKPLYNQLGGNHIQAVLHTRYFSWTLPVIGALIIASPFPDELGISLMGISKMKTYQFLLIAFLLDLLSMAIVVSLSAIIKP